jgi:hypothetical protein
MIDKLPAENRAALMEAIYAREKIAAIKMVREAADCGLAEAKAFVDKLSDEAEAKHPEKFTAPKPKGCTAALAVLTAVVFLSLLTVLLLR